jgi:multidrug efflux pump subunit AcrA (membrane-fusion protein)
MMLKRLFRIVPATVLTVSLALTGTLASLVTLSGCGEEEVTTTESIELNDPVGSVETYAVAERRDLKQITILNGKVVPHVYEYSFSSVQAFSSYENLPGVEVKKNDALVKASTEKIDEETKKLKEEMSDFMEAYDEDMAELKENLAKSKAEEAYWKEVVDRIGGWSQAELDAYNNSVQTQVYGATVPVDKAQDIINKYGNNLNDFLNDNGPKTIGSEWDSDGCQLKYIAAVADRERIEQNIKERSDNYDLDLAYYKTRLNRLSKKRSDVVVSSKIDGTVVSIYFFNEINERINKNVPVAGVGDFNDLEVKTDYVMTSDVKKAVEVYAFANGKRYDVEFVEPDPNETINSMADARSTFRVSDPEGNIKAGDYVVITIVNKQSNDALSIPNEAINKDDEGNYVYVLEGDNKVKRQIKTGIKSGMYTEILTGLDEGEKVSADIKPENKANRATLSKGSVSTDFTGNGYLFYSNRQSINNPIEWGTAYVKEINVKLNQRVAKGDPIATIWVTADDLAIRRKERAILRANEELNELIKDGEIKNEKQIKQKREYIADLNKQISEMKADAATTEIKAPFDGIITDLMDFEEGDILLSKQWIGNISSEDNCYVVVEDKAGQLTCGNTAEIGYKDANGNSVTTVGEVVTVSSWALSEQLKMEYTLIKVPSEDLEKMANSNRGADGWWRRASFSVKANVRVVNDVVLVPKRAVTTVDSITYVTVEENGKQVLKSFVAGGSDATNYWVIEGLSEGTKICLE